jgi:hypothetical protein
MNEVLELWPGDLSVHVFVQFGDEIIPGWTSGTFDFDLGKSLLNDGVVLLDLDSRDHTEEGADGKLVHC